MLPKPAKKETRHHKGFPVYVYSLKLEYIGEFISRREASNKLVQLLEDHGNLEVGEGRNPTTAKLSTLINREKEFLFVCYLFSTKVSSIDEAKSI